MATIIKKTVKNTGTRKKRPGRDLIGELPVRTIIIVLLSAAISAGVFFGARHFFLGHPFFVIKEVVVNRDRDFSFEEAERALRKLYLDRNIFSVNLKQARILIKKRYPYLKNVEVRRVPPDRIEVNIVGRTPAAVIDTAGGIVVDTEAVVIAVGGEQEGLISIRGISFFLDTPSRGKKIRNRALARALAMVKEINKRTWHIKGEIDYIDLSDKSNIQLNVSGVIVKMGSKDIQGKIEELDHILRDPNVSLNDIRYIDLRFEDPVISPR